MPKLLLITASVLLYYQGHCQFFRREIEPYIALNYFHAAPHEAYMLPQGGLSYIMGCKLYQQIGNRVAVSAGIGSRGGPHQSEYFGQSTVLVNFFQMDNWRIKFFAEAGLEIAEWSDTKVPFFLGVDQFLGNNVDWSFRMRIPIVYDTHCWKISEIWEIGLELGLKIGLPPFIPPKPITKFGNPFILH